MSYGNPNPYVPIKLYRITEDTDTPTIPTTTPIARPNADGPTGRDQATITTGVEDTTISMVVTIGQERIALPAWPDCAVGAACWRLAAGESDNMNLWVPLIELELNNVR